MWAGCITAYANKRLIAARLVQEVAERSARSTLSQKWLECSWGLR